MVSCGSSHGPAKYTRRDFLEVCGWTAAVAAIGLTPMIGEAITKASGVDYKLGKLPAADPAVKLALTDYVDLSKFPTPPVEFGQEALVPDWGMLGNDAVGDCAVAGPLHSHMLWHAETGVPINITTQCAIQNYSEISGYDPNQANWSGSNPTDQGCVVAQMVEYWRTKGMLDAAGTRHTIDAYLTLEPGNIDELWAALYLFDGAGLGMEFPESWMDDFRKGITWDAVDSQSAGGHYVMATGRRNGCINVVTWGKNQLMTPAAYLQEGRIYEAYVFVSKERIKATGQDINGFAYDKLMDDLNQLPGTHS